MIVQARRSNMFPYQIRLPLELRGEEIQDRLDCNNIGSVALTSFVPRWGARGQEGVGV